MEIFKPGVIVLLGSGETLPSSGKAHEFAVQRLPENPQIAILETPAGFELNAERVAGKIGDFLKVRLSNYAPVIYQIPARKKNTPFSPDDAEIVAPLYHADEILLGPGSPTYAVRQLRDSLAYQIILARIQLGAALVLSSAATLAFGRFTIPVYEIFKVGEDLDWKIGLDLFSRFNLPFSLVPHWNNNDGGDELDTSRCYIGRARFKALYDCLPPGQVILGIDDHTSVALDLDAKVCHVMGNGRATLLKNGEKWVFAAGDEFDLGLIGTPVIPPPGTGVPGGVWAQAVAVHQSRIDMETKPPDPPTQAVIDLLKMRQIARETGDWAESDRLRDQIKMHGWQVNDTLSGPELIPLE